jgi:hypothetical protein
MGLMDILTGGKNEDAVRALREAQARFDAIKAPGIEQLTLPQLQQYVNAGLMTPAQMEAYLQESNAYNTQNIPQEGTAAQIAALNQLSGVANAGAEGTPVSRAQQAQTIQAMNQAVGGNRGAAEQAAAARGTPAAMIQMATSGMNAGQDAQQAYQNALQGQAQAYQQAVNAMAQGGQLGGQLQGQQNTQANTVSAAQNAMQQFNAQNQQNAAANNAQMRQQANAYNTENAQNVGNQNTGLANQRTMYNTQLPQQVFQNAIQKAGGQANISGQQANQATAAGQQEAGLWGGLIGSGITAFGSPAAGMAAKQATTQPMRYGQNSYSGYGAHGGIVSDHEGCYHGGGICLEGGGVVPGKAKVPGDSVQNDKVHAMLSPGEAILSRTTTQENLPEVLGMLGESPPQIHSHDVATILKALRELRMGTA